MVKRDRIIPREGSITVNRAGRPSPAAPSPKLYALVVDSRWITAMIATCPVFFVRTWVFRRAELGADRDLEMGRLLKFRHREPRKPGPKRQQRPKPSSQRMYRFFRRTLVPAGILAVIVGLIAIEMYRSPWPPLLTLRHLASVPNCATARLVRLAPAMRGEPGYWPQHDRDRDGIACETWPRR